MSHQLCSEAICLLSEATTYLHNISSFSSQGMPHLKIKLIPLSTLCLVLPIAYLPLTLLQLQLSLANNMYILSKCHVTFLTVKRLPKYEVWRQGGKEE